MFRNVMVYLGLGPDDEYDDNYLYEDEPDDTVAATGGHRADPNVMPSGRHEEPSAFGVAADRDRRSGASGPEGSTSTVGSVRPIRSVGRDDDTPNLRVRAISPSEPDESGSVRPVALQRTKPKAVTPQSFGDAKIIADEFKRSVPVIMNLQESERDLARRLIDFASGVCYVLGGAMEKLAPNVFLLVPRGTEVSAEDRRRIEERGFDR